MRIMTLFDYSFCVFDGMFAIRGLSYPMQSYAYSGMFKEWTDYPSSWR